MDERIVNRPLRVLVVDDSPDFCYSTSLLLRLWGHDVSVASDGAAALEQATSYRPDVVLLDLGLPYMDGYEVARRLRSMDVPQPFLVSLSGYGNEEYTRRAREVGCDVCWIKPADPDALQQLLASRQQVARKVHHTCN
jgi:two-component system CheB/CheR fusion protein